MKIRIVSAAVTVTAIAALTAACGTTGAAPSPPNANSQHQYITKLTADRWKASVKPTVSKLGNDLTNVTNAANAGDMTALDKACASGLHHTADLQAKPPWPGKEAKWNKVLDQLSNGFATCVGGDYSGAAAGLSQANEGLAHLEAG